MEAGPVPSGRTVSKGNSMKSVLLTGGAGFIGHHVAAHILKKTDWKVIFLDRLDVSGNLNRIVQAPGWETNKPRCKFIFHDLKAEINSQLAQQIGKVDIILHLGASTHVDRSISDPVSFVLDNVLGTAHILNFAKHCPRLERFIYFSTDEVFGPAPQGKAFKEWDSYRSTNPYAASKAGGEELALSYYNTYSLPVIITHTMNVFGERQHPEKFIPMTISNILKGKQVLVHSNKLKTQAGSRFYLHALNVANALLFLLDKGISGDKYNIVGEVEVDNLALAKTIADLLEKELHYEMVDFHSSRPGHDLRYALDGTKMREMGYTHEVKFPEGLERVVKWTVQNPEWMLA